MAVPPTKTAVKALIDLYIPPSTGGSPNILATEHKLIETAILDRIDGRILATGEFTLPNATNGYFSKTITFSPFLSTANYIVSITPVNCHGPAWGISHRSYNGFTVEITKFYAEYAKFWYTCISMDQAPNVI